MGKNILVITGSPRKEGNSDLMADAFIEGAATAGHTVTKFAAAMKKIQGCIACDKCWSNGKACVFNDGFTELESLLENADVIVISTPLYWSNLPSQLKAPIDKLYAYVAQSCKRPLKIKESLFMVCGECEGEQIFSGIIDTYQGLCEYMKWQDKGILAVPKVNKPGDIATTDALQRAKGLGLSI
jgi:putative NADPH-quinone reductase